MKTHLQQYQMYGMSLRQSAFMPMLRWLVLSALAMIPLHQAGAAAPTPTVAFPTVSGITYTSATLGGNVTSRGGSVITGRGVVYSPTATNPSPQIGGIGVTQRAAAVGIGTGVFTLVTSALTPGTTYSFRAYATNNSGTAYSSSSTFTTPADPPVIGAASVASITINSASLGGNVTSDNSSAITQRGVVYSTTASNGDPTLTNGASVAVAVTASTGVFTVPVSGLLSSTQYSFKAYATNSIGTTYTAVSTFTTLPYAPTVTSPTASSVTLDTATLGGNVTSSNSAAITERGVVYSLTTSNGDPSLTNGASVAVAATATTGVFTVPVTGLQSSKLYYFRAYATNSVGTTYSWTSTFTTLPYAPAVGSPTYSSLTTNSATLGGNVTSENSAPVTARGIVYSVTSVNGSPSLTNGASVVVHDTAGTGVFTVAVAGLLPSTNYSFRAYATNSMGTSYSWTNSFTTYPYAPSIGSPTSSLITGSTAVLGGTVFAANQAVITERGVVYSSTDNDPRINDLGVTKGTVAGTTGLFTRSVTGLVPRTVYYFRAYATNSVGTSYTSLGMFTTLDVPTVIEPTDTSITTTGATLGGNVTSDNLAPITERGVVYSISSSNNNPLVGAPGVTKEIVAGTTGVFTIPITGLANGTTYSYKAYATNSEGTAYSDVLTFQTTPVIPTISTPTSVDVATDASTAIGSVTLGGNVTYAGAEFIERGVVVSPSGVNSDPLIGGNGVTQTISNDIAGTTGAFTIAVTGLSPNVLYTFKAYVKNVAGLAYTSTATFRPPAVAPVLSPPSAGSITTTQVTLGGNVIHDGGLAITSRGFVYSATVSTGLKVGAANTTTVADTIGVGEGVAGPFSVDKTGLQLGTTYNYVAYAANGKGYTYTPVSTFTTSGTVPTVTTPSKTLITGTSATLGGTVAKTNGSDILVRGVVYSSTDPTPTIEENADFAVSTSTPGLGTFTAAVTGLSPATLYYFSAYAENDDGNGYSVVSSFTTLAGAPSVTTGTAGEPTSSSVAVSGNNVDANGAAITERGIVVSLTSVSASPALGVAGSKVFVHATDAEGLYSVAATGLLPFSQYSYRAYAINVRGTSYGAARTFTTAAAAPTVNTPVATNLAARTVTLGGKIEKANGAAITEYGVKVYQAGILIDTYSLEAAKLGSFTFSVTGLTPATAYTFEAFATNSKGTGTSARVAFTTRKAVPTVETSSSAVTGLVRGLVVDTNGAAVTRYGVIYSTSSTATLVLGGTNTLVKAVTGTTEGLFSVTVPFKSGKTYYFKTFAYNGIGYGYSAKESIVIPAAAPTVNARAATLVANSSATLGGNILDNGGKAIIERGVRYWKTATPANKTSKIIAGTALGIFSAPVYNLTPGTAYTFQAYAENSEGTTYSSTLTFTTTGTAPALLAGASAGAGSAGTSETYYTTDAATGLKYLTIVISDAAQAPTVEVSGNLTDWFSGSSHTTVISDAAGILKVRDNTPVTAGVKRYIRVRP